MARTVSDLPGIAPSRRAWLVGTLCYVSAAFFWGMNIPMTKVLLDTYDPMLLAAVRTLIAALVLLVVILSSEGSRALRPGISLHHWLACSVAFAAFLVLYNLGLRYTEPVTAAAIMAGTPVYAAVCLRLFTGARLVPGFALAATLTVVGALVAVFGRGIEGVASGRHGGEILIVLSFVCWNLYTLTSQRWFDSGVSQVARTCFGLCGAGLWAGFAWLVLAMLGQVPIPTELPAGLPLLWLMMTAVLATGMGVMLWNIGVSHLGLANGSLWQNMVPVFGVLVSLSFGFWPLPSQLVGGAIVLAGVLWMQRVTLLRARRA
ncbi:MAG: DMT family transporter [Burkholderiaceae bacterium]